MFRNSNFYLYLLSENSFAQPFHLGYASVGFTKAARAVPLRLLTKRNEMKTNETKTRLRIGKSAWGGFCVALFLFAAMPSAFAQNGIISGKVLDSSGEPLIGAYVCIPGTKVGAITDIDGKYHIAAPKGSKLEFSFIGCKAQTITVGDADVVNITLDPDNTSLEESVVVGYGVQKRRDIVGAVEVLKTDEIAERTGSQMNMSRALQGNVPGLTLTFTDGKPTRGATVRIRGNVTSIGSGGSALVLIDGVEGDMNMVNPEDI